MPSHSESAEAGATTRAWTPRWSAAHSRYYFERRDPPETSWTCVDAPEEWNCSEQERVVVAAMNGLAYQAAETIVGVATTTPRVLERLHASSRSPYDGSPFANGSPVSAAAYVSTPPHKSMTSSPRRRETPGEGERSALYAALQRMKVARDELARQAVIDAYEAKQALSTAHAAKKALERRCAAELAALTKQYNAEIEAHDAEVERFMAHRAAMAAERVATLGVVRAEAAADVAEARAGAATSVAAAQQAARGAIEQAEVVHTDEAIAMRVQFQADVAAARTENKVALADEKMAHNKAIARMAEDYAALENSIAEENERRTATRARAARHALKQAEAVKAKATASHHAELQKLKQSMAASHRAELEAEREMHVKVRGTNERHRRAAEHLHRHAKLTKALADDQAAEIAAKDAEIKQLRAELASGRVAAAADPSVRHPIASAPPPLVRSRLSATPKKQGLSEAQNRVQQRRAVSAPPPTPSEPRPPVPPLPTDGVPGDLAVPPPPPLEAPPPLPRTPLSSSRRSRGRG